MKNSVKVVASIATIVLCVACAHSDKISNSLTLNSNRPAEKWEECMPLGNGRIGMMPDGNINKETVVLNDITLWSGGPQDADNPEAAKHLPEIRKLLFEGKNDQAQALVYKTFACKGAGSGHGNGSEVPYGAFEMLGNLYIEYDLPEAEASQYSRGLSLNDATSWTTFTLNGVKYSRQYIADFSQDVLRIHLEADQANALSFKVGIDRPRAFSVDTQDNTLIMSGQLQNGDQPNGMKYMAKVAIVPVGDGSVSVQDKQLVLQGAKEADIIIALGTDYKRPDFETTIAKQLVDAQKATFKHAQVDHVRIYQELFNRVTLDLGNKNPERDTLTTAQRLLAFAKDPNDNGLVELYFQFGRYLSICSTREGLLPPNLQGLWANTIRTPWNGDYHMNINVQMNHWPLEVVNLSELHMPLFDLTESLVEPGKKTAQAFYNADGWVAHMMTNIWGYTAPGEHPSWGATNTGGAWMTAHMWEHFLFTQDTAFLKRAYPTLKGSAEFFLSMLVTEPTHNWLVTAPTSSPENAYYLPNSDKTASICMGSTMDNQILRELFSNTIAAANILKCDNDFCAQLQAAIDLLPPDRIGSDGRLLEWLEEYKEVEPTHRHVSHLYGLYPGNQISPITTPDLADAARKTLEVRTDGGTGWSRAWKINFWARLHDGEHAFRVLCNLLNPTGSSEFNYGPGGGGTYANLFCAHPPFQIDGNFGGCAGIAEMLIQSHTGVIDILPAIPQVMNTGSFTGLRVRGGAEVDAKWANGQLTNLTLKVTANNTFPIQLPESLLRLQLTKNNKPFDATIDDTNILQLSAQKGDTFQLTFNY